MGWTVFVSQFGPLCPPSQANLLLTGVLGKWVTPEPGLPVRMSHLAEACVNSRCLSASVCHPATAAAALCARVCVCDTRTATYPSLFVFAFQKAAAVSVVVQ